VGPLSSTSFRREEDHKSVPLKMGKPVCFGSSRKKQAFGAPLLVPSKSGWQSSKSALKPGELELELTNPLSPSAAVSTE
jgi:hypothetical protein